MTTTDSDNWAAREGAYLEKAMSLMQALGIPVRDTFDRHYNWDDFYVNGHAYGGPRHFAIVSADVSNARTGSRMYAIPGRESVAYDRFVITLPLTGDGPQRDDPIIHECVHFLQHNTLDEDAHYIPFDGHNYLDYISQRVEREAHLTQILYLLRDCEPYCRSVLDAEQEAGIREHLADYLAGHESKAAILAISAAKAADLI